MPSLTLIRGLPGSGKSTLAKALLRSMSSSTRHFEADMFFVDKTTGVYEFKPMRIGDAHDWCQMETQSALIDGESVIVSNTFTKLSEMTPYFEFALSLTGKLPNVILCQGQFGSVHGIPDQVMVNMRKRFAHDISPLVDQFTKFEDLG